MKTFLAIALFVLVTRLGLYFIGLAPDADTLLNHMQVLDFGALTERPIGSLWWLHMQPPLWNAIVGAAAHITGGDLQKTAGLIHVLHIIATIGMAGCMLLLGRLLGCNRVLVLAFCFAMVVSPPVLYFETHIFYSHLSAAFLLGSVTGAFAYLRTKRLTALALFLATLVPLPWIWSIFHPLAASFFAVAILLAADRRMPAPMLMVIAAVFLVFAPTLKSLLVFGQPTSSSWLGLNLSQTVDLPGALEMQCRFTDAFEEIENTTAAGTRQPLLDDGLKGSGHINANHRIFLERGPLCTRAAVSAILQDPLTYLKSRVDRLAASHGMPSYYYFFGPIGWEKFQAFDRPWDNGATQAQSILQIAFATVFVAMLGLAVASRHRSLFLTVAGCIIYFEAVSHLFNGMEQERMRYSIEPLYWLVVMYCMDVVLRRIRHGRGYKPAAPDRARKENAPA